MRTEEGWRESSIEFAKVTNECFASNVMFTLESKCGLIGSEVRVHFSRARYENSWSRQESASRTLRA